MPALLARALAILGILLTLAGLKPRRQQERKNEAPRMLHERSSTAPIQDDASPATAARTGGPP